MIESRGAGAATSASFELDGATGSQSLALSGDWTSEGMERAPDRLAKARRAGVIAALDVAGLGRMDTAGACCLIRYVGLDAALFTQGPVAALRPDVALLATFLTAAPDTKVPPQQPRALWLTRFGKSVDQLLDELSLNLAFLGEFMEVAGRAMVRPSHLRLAPIVTQMQRAGLDAVAIVAAANLFVGATIGFLGATLLGQFGASVFTVELVGVGVMREFAVLITAVILAGRSASSFAAEIGAMKMNQEVDAMLVMGVDPFDALVVPRFLAMLTMTPFLIFIAMVAGLVGGMLVVWPVLDLSPQFFLTRIVEHVGVRHFWIGMSKAPVMAMLIAVIGCRQGLAVQGDVEQLGRRVTSAVVQALFAILAVDAVFALMYMELNL